MSMEPLNYNLRPLIELAKKEDAEAKISASYKDLGVKVTITVEPL